MTNLNEVTFGVNKYCGPSVLSILTGKSTDECARAISRFSGQKVVKATKVNYILQALDYLGFDQIRRPLIARSLFGCLNGLANFDGFYLIVIPDHIVAIEIKNKHIYFCDNHTRKPINAEASARLMQEVLDIYQVKERPKPAISPTAEANLSYLLDLEAQLVNINHEIASLQKAKREIEETISLLK